MTKTVNPISLVFSIRQCFFVFLLQILIAYLFSKEFLSFDNFSDFSIYKTFMRIFMPILTVMSMRNEIRFATKMITYLKRSRGRTDNERGRFVNIGLASM